MPTRTLLVRVIALSLLGATGAVKAQQFAPLANPPQAAAGSIPQFNYSLELGIEHDDNINQSATDPVSQDVLIPRFYFDYAQNGSTFQAHVVGQVEYRDYLQGDFSNEFRGQLAGVLNWVLLPQRLTFTVTDSSNVEPVNTLVSNGPNNLQQVNVFGAGPTLRFRMASNLRGQIEAQYLNTTASKNDFFDSQRGFGALRITDDLSPTDAISGNLEYQHVDFTHPEIADNLRISQYDDYNVYGRYQRTLAQFDLDAALGWSHYAFSGGAPSQAGLLSRAGITWRPTSRSSLELAWLHQLTDITQQLLAQPSRLVAGTDPSSIQVGNSFIAPQVYRQNAMSANYSYQGDRFGLALTSYYERDRYPNYSALNHAGPGTAATIGWHLLPLMTAGFRAFAERTSYTALDRRDKSFGFGPYLTRIITPQWSWRINYTHYRRSSTNADAGYTDNTLYLTLSYSR